MNEYLVLIPLQYSARFLFYYFGLSAILFFSSRLLFKSNIKAGCWTTSILIIFFFWGISQDFLKTLPLPAFFSSYTFLLSVTFLFSVTLAWRFYKKQAPLKLNRFFNLLFAVLLLLEAGISVFKLSDRQVQKTDLAYYDIPLPVNLAAIDNRQKPDIFFIVFDEYTSTKALKKYFHFDNSPLDSALLRNNFFISANSQSNYNSTTLSIASTLNMQYFNRDLDNTPNDVISLLKGVYSIQNSMLPEILKKQGYDIINYGLFTIKDHPVPMTPAFEDHLSKALSLETLGGRFMRDLYWNIDAKLIKTPWDLPYREHYVTRDKNNHTRLLNEINREAAQPRFVVGHIHFPHRPAYVDRYGHFRKGSPADYKDAVHDSLYIDQLLYTNTLINSLANAANQPRNRPLVLIIEGDHGNRYAEWGRTIREKQFMNLNTYYFSDRNYSMLYDGISPVNSFRVVLNKYFGTELPLLKDSTILLN